MLITPSEAGFLLTDPLPAEIREREKLVELVAQVVHIQGDMLKYLEQRLS